MSQITSSGITIPGGIGAIPTTFITSAGNAIPALNILTLTNGANITMSGAGAAVTVAVVASPTFTTVNATTFDTNVLAAGVTLAGTTWAADGTDANIGMTITPKGTGDLTLTIGDVAISSGNLTLPTTSATVGQITINGTPVLHGYGTGNIFLGGAGNFTLDPTRAINNVAIGILSLEALVGSAPALGTINTCVGERSGRYITDGAGNSLFGASAAVKSFANTGLTTGNNNVIVGFAAGANYTGAESDNIILGALVDGVVGESSITRIGYGMDAVYISGIRTTTATPTANAFVTLVDTNDLVYGLANSTTGYVLTSNGATDSPTWQAIAAGGMFWSREVNAAVALAQDHGYVNTNVGLTTFTLPVVAALGTVIEIVGESAGLFTIAQNAGQNIQYANLSTTPGVGGSLSASNRYDTVRIVCRVASTTWAVSSVTGILNVI